MEIKFLGATETVTGSKYLLSFDSKKVLVDCGLFQGYKNLRLRNWHKFPIDPQEIDAVILTHAHIDHSGYIPLLVKNGFKGKIYSTNGTADLASILLPDCGHLQEEEAMLANKLGYSKHKPALPLYTKLDALKSLKQFETLSFGEECSLSKNISFSFGRAGHILGAAFVILKFGNKLLVFTGDMGRRSDPIMYDPEIITEADYLVLESTYGDRLHEKKDVKDQIGEIIRNTVAGSGSVIIPSFAVGRAQNLLYYIGQLQEANKIPHVSVFLDSPMAISATHILIKNKEDHRLSKEECKKLSNVATYINTPDESKAIDHMKKPVVIISASGMATGGRILFHLKAYAPDPRNTILFTGYQAGGTRGDRIIRGEKEVKIHGEMIPINAKI
jgi:metallo-beta-lactamase family protein